MSETITLGGIKKVINVRLSLPESETDIVVTENTKNSEEGIEENSIEKISSRKTNTLANKCMYL